MNRAAQASAETSTDHSVISSALSAVKRSAGIDGKLLEFRQDGAVVSLHLAGKSTNYVCTVKRKIDRAAVLLDLRARARPGSKALLVCMSMSSAMVEQCRQLSIQFIDAAGNAYLDNGRGLYVYIAGLKSEQTVSALRRDATITPSALRVMFAVLAEPALLNAAYRDLAAVAGISIGGIGKAFDTMEAAGFIGTIASTERRIRDPERMLSEWATGYLQRLRPSLEKYRFSATGPLELGTAWKPQQAISAWGGEWAAAYVTSHLKPATCTIYAAAPSPKLIADLVKQFRLRADPDGPIEIVKAFWRMDRLIDFFPTVPLHLIYADLLETNDPRNLTVAELIAKKVIKHVHDAQGQAA